MNVFKKKNVGKIKKNVKNVKKRALDKKKRYIYVIHSAASVRDLGVTLDSELTLQRHVNKVASACFYHIRRLKQRSADCLDLTLRPVLFLRSC